MIMKKRGALGLALLSSMAVLLLSATISAPRVLAAPSPKTAESELRAIYKKRQQSIVRHDAEALIAYETSDFRQRMPSGYIGSKKQVDDSWRRSMKQTKSDIDSLKYTEFHVKASGNKAIVSYLSQLDSVSPRVKSSGAILRQRTRARVQDTWIRTASGWRIQFSDMKSVKNVINGKVVK